MRIFCNNHHVTPPIKDNENMSEMNAFIWTNDRSIFIMKVYISKPMVSIKDIKLNITEISKNVQYSDYRPKKSKF